MKKTDISESWQNARNLKRDLAIPEFHIPFTDWFTQKIESDYKINDDWKVEEGAGGELMFWITQRVVDEVALNDKGPPVERVGRMSHDAANMGWNEGNNPQTHAIMEEEDG